jgi:rhamnosyltransferase
MNAGPLFSEFLKAIRRQQLRGLSLDLTVIDSCSTDTTVALAREQGVNLFQINPARFNSGFMRNWALKNTSGDVVVFLGQHAMPRDAQLVQCLLEPFEDPLVAGVYGRRISPSDGDLWTSRTWNGWPTHDSEPITQFLEDGVNYRAMPSIERYQLCNFDMACCALRRCVGQEIPFRAAEFAEGLAWSQRVLEAGWKITYRPDACVVYSHKQTLKREFKQAYLLHQTLFQLFGLNFVPSVRSLAVSPVRSIFHDWFYVAKHEPNFFRRILLLMRLPALHFITAYAQYRGVRDAQVLAKKDHRS